MILCEHVLQAEAEALSVWLISSNIANYAFYNSLGCETIARFTVGDDNPTWEGGPIVVMLASTLLMMAVNCSTVTLSIL